MENNKLSTGLTVWLWIIFVVNVLAAIGGIVVARGASVVGAALGLGSIYVVPVSYTHLIFPASLRIIILKTIVMTPDDISATKEETPTWQE